MAQAATVFCLMCLFLAAAYGYQEQPGNPLPSPQAANTVATIARHSSNAKSFFMMILLRIGFRLADVG